MNMRKIASAVMISLVALGALAGPALADNDWGNGRGHNKHGHKHRHHERETVYAPDYVYGPPRVVYAPPPRVVYAPPPVYYAAPPVMYESSPSINFIFPLR
ncbi:MAG: hypothetical protein H7Z12_04500 [Rhodospirillaceae bacterium]|nr:hypothetical protein [Rhodospirillales bacterium]